MKKNRVKARSLLLQKSCDYHDVLSLKVSLGLTPLKLLRLEEYRNEGAEEVPLRVEEPFSGEASPAEGQGRAGGDDRHRVVQTHRVAIRGADLVM